MVGESETMVSKSYDLFLSDIWKKTALLITAHMINQILKNLPRGPWWQDVWAECPRPQLLLEAPRGP